MTFYYLSAESIRDINIAFCGEGAGIRDMNGFLGVVERPQTNVFGRELFPDVFSKAAVYLHGFATTQYFTDGNKRTGFLSATVFLSIHDNIWLGPNVDDAETFLLAVADKQYSISDVADWLKSLCVSQPLRDRP